MYFRLFNTWHFVVYSVIVLLSLYHLLSFPLLLNNAIKSSHVCPTGRYWVCCPQWPDADTQGGRSQTPPLIPGPCHPPSSDKGVASSSGQTHENDAPDRTGSCWRGPAEADESFLWESRNRYINREIGQCQGSCHRTFIYNFKTSQDTGLNFCLQHILLLLPSHSCLCADCLLTLWVELGGCSLHQFHLSTSRLSLCLYPWKTHIYTHIYDYWHCSLYSFQNSSFG